MSPEEVSLITRCVRDPAIFARAFFHSKGYLMDGTIPAFGLDAYKLIGQKAARTAVILPRGHLKSTLVSQIYALWVAITKPGSYVVIVTSTEKLLTALSSAIDHALRYNDTLKYYFGPQARADDTTYNIHRRVLANGSTLGFFTVGSQLRGTKDALGNRPTLIILDDIETTDSASSAEQSNKIVEWFGSECEPALGPSGRVILVGNVISKLSMTHRIATKAITGWNFMVRSAVDFEKGTVLWPQHKEFSLSYFQEKLENLRSSNAEHRFYAEYLNRPREAVNQPYKIENVIYGEPQPGEPVSYFAAFDIAYSDASKKKSDHSAWVIGVTDAKNILYVLEAGRARLAPADCINRITAIYNKYRHLGLGSVHVEANLAFISAMEAEQRRLNSYYNIIPLKTNGVAKADRILAHVRLPYIRFAYNNPGVEGLIAELLQWSEKATIDDQVDTLAYLRSVATECSTIKVPDAPKWVPEITKRALAAMFQHTSGPDFSVKNLRSEW